MRKIFSGSRYLIMIAVVGSYVSALALLLYGGVDIIRLLINFFSVMRFNADYDKRIIVTFIDIIDKFLLGIVFYINILGLYELFIDEKNSNPRLAGHSQLRCLERQVGQRGHCDSGSAVSWECCWSHKCAGLPILRRRDRPGSDSPRLFYAKSRVALGGIQCC